MSDELKPCPFCGNSAIIVEIGGGAAFRVKCHNFLECGAETEIFDTEAEATEAWNRRVPTDHSVAANKSSDNPPLTLEELRGMDGEPVWIEPTQQWRIVAAHHENEFVTLYTVCNTISAKNVLNNDGRIYRHKPEEE